MKNLKLLLLGAISLSSSKAFLQNFPVSSSIGDMGNNITTEINEIEVPPEIQSTVIVTKNNLQTSGWTTEHVEKNKQTTVTSVIKNTDYITIPCQSIDRNKGIHLMLPISTAVNELRRIRLRNTQFSGLFLHDVTSLSYAAYITLTHENIAPSLVLQIDTDLDDKPDFNLAFQPRDQASQNQPCDGIIDFPEVHLHEWHTWNALDGWWQIGIGDPVTNLPFSLLLDLLSDIHPPELLILQMLQIYMPGAESDLRSGPKKRAKWILMASLIILSLITSVIMVLHQYTIKSIMILKEIKIVMYGPGYLTNGILKTEGYTFS